MSGISEERLAEYRQEALSRVGHDMGKHVPVLPHDLIAMLAEIRSLRAENAELRPLARLGDEALDASVLAAKRELEGEG